MKKYLFLLSAMALMSACQSEPMDLTTDDAPVAVRISGRVAMSVKPASRAQDASWSAGDQIGVYLLNEASTDVVSGQNNLPYVTENGDGTFAAVETEAMIPAASKSTYDVAAYYPYGELTEGAKSINLTDQSKPETIDLMAARVSGVSREHASAALTFSHKLAKIELQITSEGLSLEGLAVRLTNQKTEAAYNPVADELKVNGDPTNLTLRTYDKAANNHSVKAEAIVLPNSAENEAADRQIQFELADNLYIATIGAATAFEAGKKYCYEVSFTSTGEAVIVGAGIQDWESGAGDGNSTILKPEEAELSQIYLMGSMNGWSQTAMTAEGNGVFTWKGNMFANQELKFTVEPNGNYDTYQIMSPYNGQKIEEDVEMHGCLAYYLVGGIDNKWNVVEDGYYTIKIDVSEIYAIKVTFTRVGSPRIEDLYLIGSASPSNWDMSKAPHFELTDAENCIFTLTTILYAGELKMPMRTDRGFGCDFLMAQNSGDQFVPDGVTVMQGKWHKDGDEGDDKWEVPADCAEKTYTITVDGINLTMTAVEVPSEPATPAE